MRAAILILSAILLMGCYSQNRCTRLATKCGWTSDTVTVIDSITIERTFIDSFIRWEQLRYTDTITLERERIRVRLIASPEGLLVEAETPDTVIRYVRQVVTKVAPPKRERYGQGFIWLALIVGILIGGWVMARK